MKKMFRHTVPRSSLYDYYKNLNRAALWSPFNQKTRHFCRSKPLPQTSQFWFQRNSNYMCTTGNLYASEKNCRRKHTGAANDEEDKDVCLQTEKFPPSKIRNFSIIAHIDHGKSTLSDRLMELTGTVKKSTDNKQILDKLQVEKERGITVKAQTASMIHRKDGEDYLLNLLDTPGHVDFSFEVSRSLSACDGVILVVDANQGVQAQTFSNFYMAFAKNLPVIPVINKIDLKKADPEKVAEQLNSLFEIEKDCMLKLSAKSGLGVPELLDVIVNKIPHPTGSRDLESRALIFDCWYNRFKGVALLIVLRDGKLSLGEEICITQSGKIYEIKEIGILHPDPTPLKTLYAGQLGYIYCNMRSVKEAMVGGTICHSGKKVEVLPGFVKSKPMVFAGLYPFDQSEHPALKSSLEKLLLNDSSVECVSESSAALGHGYRLGFLGVLHMEVFTQRLEQEYGTDVVLTAPSVPIKVKVFGAKNVKKYGGEIFTVSNPSHLPDRQIISELYEPFVHGTIITPAVYMGDILSLCLSRRGVQLDSKNIDADRLLMTFKLPLTEIVVDFYDKLKSLTSGYASFDYEEAEYEPSDMIKMSILLNGKEVDEMSTIVHAVKARETGKIICNRLKDTIPQHQFQVSIQACVGGKIIAREDLKALRKDVVAKLYGGDRTRRTKLLKFQAEGKRRMKKIGTIDIPRETFIKILQR